MGRSRIDLRDGLRCSLDLQFADVILIFALPSSESKLIPGSLFQSLTRWAYFECWPL